MATKPAASLKSTVATISTGKCAIWFSQKGFGFISPDSGGDDVFCHWSKILDGDCLHKGATVNFLKEVGTNGKEWARNVTGGAKANTKPRPPLPKPNEQKGTVCVWKKCAGYGFIKPESGGKDVFCHHVDILDGDYLEPGKEVHYCVEYDAAKDKYSAINVTGGIRISPQKDDADHNKHQLSARKKLAKRKKREKLRILREMKKSNWQRLQQDRIQQWNPHDPETTSHTPKTTNTEATLFVGRLAKAVDEPALRKFFCQYGEVVTVALVRSVQDGTLRGYAFIEFKNKDDCALAFRDADAKLLMGRRIVVDYERGRTDADWKPRYLGGGLGCTRAGGLRDRVNDHHAGRVDSCQKRKANFENERRRIAALKRVKIELVQVIRSRYLFGRIAVAPHPRNWMEWRVSVTHPTNPHRAAAFVLQFPDEYPFRPPLLVLHPDTTGPDTTPLASHPSFYIDAPTDPAGRSSVGLCLAGLEDWSPTSKVLTVLTQLLWVFQDAPDLRVDDLSPLPEGWPVPEPQRHPGVLEPLQVEIIHIVARLFDNKIILY